MQLQLPMPLKAAQDPWAHRAMHLLQPPASSRSGRSFRGAHRFKEPLLEGIYCSLHTRIAAAATEDRLLLRVPIVPFLAKEPELLRRARRLHDHRWGERDGSKVVGQSASHDHHRRADHAAQLAVQDAVGGEAKPDELLAVGAAEHVRPLAVHPEAINRAPHRRVGGHGAARSKVVPGARVSPRRLLRRLAMAKATRGGRLGTGERSKDVLEAAGQCVGVGRILCARGDARATLYAVREVGQRQAVLKRPSGAVLLGVELGVVGVQSLAIEEAHRAAVADVEPLVRATQPRVLVTSRRKVGVEVR
eukprot:3891569-Prymnesium_polylepis.2